jgi:hypothetical protein
MACLESSQCTYFVVFSNQNYILHNTVPLQTKTHFHVFLDKPKYIFIYSPRAVHMICLVDSWFSEEPSTKGCFKNTFIIYINIFFPLKKNRQIIYSCSIPMIHEFWLFPFKKKK